MKVKLVRPEDVTPEMLQNLVGGELTPEELAEVYRLGREMFTAADLQKYTELDEGVPAEDVIREMEEMLQQGDQRKE
jgi:hypothetical protein